MKLYSKDLQYILIGSSLLGNGGGGRYDVAFKLQKNINIPVNLININDVNQKDLIVTAYGVGGLKKKGNIIKINNQNMQLLSKILKQKIKYLIAVEIGPVSVMNLINIASNLNLSVIDGDLVGYRSSPEVYLEGITLNNTNRLPIIASNSSNDRIILSKASSIKEIESILRTFSTQSLSKVYVAGYPLTKKNIINYFGNGSLSYSIKIGKIIINSKNNKELINSLKLEKIIYIDDGIIKDQQNLNIEGFTAGKLLIKSANNRYEVIYKNEFLVLLKNDKLLLTCPDSILLFDTKSRIGINNGNNNINNKVLIFARKAESYWRTEKGLKLFSPKTIGLDYQQKILT